MPTTTTPPAPGQRTLVICKPDAVERALVGEIVRRLEAKGLRLVAAELRLIDVDVAKQQYDEHRDRPFFEDLISFMTRGPSMVLVVEGPEDTWRVVRLLVGATDPKVADPGTIRGDLGLATTENLVHASDSAESAQREISIYFPQL